MWEGQRLSAADFPPPDYDEDVRRAYRGGFTYVNPKFKGKVLGEGIVFDVNSLYPSVMAGCDGQLLPYGDPKPFKGEPPKRPGFPLWCACVTIDCTLKPDHIPCMQVKESAYSFAFTPTEYITDTKGEVVRWLTNVDLKLIREQYDINELEFHRGYLFRGSDKLFRKFVDERSAVKMQARRDGNEGLATIAKLDMNGGYGKMGTNPIVGSKMPCLREDGSVGYKDLERETREPVYIPYAVFVTAWARYKTITSAQAVYDRFVYADTDSLHLVGTEIPASIDVDPVRLGAWKHESTFQTAKFLRAKTYVEVIDGKLNIHCAGLPERCFDYDEKHETDDVPEHCETHVDLENFEIGTRYWGKLTPHHVPGGVVLEDTYFTVRG